MIAGSFTEPRLAAAQISLPISDMADGLGEQFSVDPFKGSGSLLIPLAVSSARGFQPELSLSYTAGGANSPVGLGFSLGPRSVSRSTLKGIPRYTDEDRFDFGGHGVLSPQDGGPESIEIAGVSYQVTRYLPGVIRTAERIERWVRVTDGDTIWRCVEADGTVSLYGLNSAARIFDPSASWRVFEWLLQVQYDSKGNAIRYDYLAEDGANLSREVWEQNREQRAQKYLSAIRYGCTEPFNPPPYGIGEPPEIGWHVEIVFDYGQYNPVPSNPSPYTKTGTWSARQDPFSTYMPGFEVRTHRLLRHIMLFHRFDALGADPALEHLSRFVYDEKPVATQLVRLDMIGCMPNWDRHLGEDPYLYEPLPPLELTYTTFDPMRGEFEPVEVEAGETLPGLTVPPYTLVDLQGQGVPGVLYSDGNTVLYWPPAAGEKPEFAPAKTLENFPSLGTPGSAAAQFMDVTGDGRVDVVVAEGSTVGFYEALGDSNWAPLRSFSSTPSDFLSPDSVLADLTGDGRDDLVNLGQTSLRYYPSEGAAGFGSPEVRATSRDMPSSVGVTPHAKIVFADLFGTGETHLVRVMNGTVECWPSLGYGVFGEKITLGNAPRFEGHFDAERLTIADFTGTGGADLMYTMADRVLIFRNQGGNSFAEPVAIPLPVVLSTPAQMTLADLRGTGMPCILVALLDGTPTHLCLALNAGVRPYFLSGINNNRGATTEITYGTSAQCWLQDVQGGLPWITNLPFPVPVVTGVVRNDLVSQCSTTETYSYHHGYFDGFAREFRGFGFVERSDSQLFKEATPLLRETGDPAPPPAPSNVPVLTRTWFHTGAYLAEAPLEAQYRREWFQGDPRAYVMPGPTFDWGGDVPDDATTIRQAHAALRGQVLHTELYGLDGSPAQSMPYAVHDSAQTVRLVQQRTASRSAVFMVYDREAIQYSYERDPADPAADHDFTLAVDQYGQTTLTCTLAYGRRAGQSGALPVQERMLATSASYDYINLDQGEVFHIGIPWRLVMKEVSGLTAPAGGYFSWDEIEALIHSGEETADAPTFTVKQWHEFFYYGDDGTTQAPPGQAGKQALLYTSRTAAFAAQDIETLFLPVLSPQALADKLNNAHYFLDTNQEYWWVPGPVVTYYDAGAFYLPQSTHDEFGCTATYTYDASGFALISVLTTAPGLHDTEIKVDEFDYNSLQPVQVTDEFGTVGQVQLSPLGQVVIWTYYSINPPVGFYDIVGYRPLPSSMEEVLAYPSNFLWKFAQFNYYNPLSWSGQVQASSLSALQLDSRALLAALAEAGYVTPEGVLLDKLRSLPGAQALILPPPYDTRRNEIYDVLAAVLTRPPHWLRLIAQDFPGVTTPPQIQVDYLDGFGRVVQGKAKVEPGTAFVTGSRFDKLSWDKQLAPAQEQVDPRWLTSAAVRYNGSGQIATRYEPFFIDSYLFLDAEQLAALTVHSTISYDSLDRLVREDTPDGFFRKTEIRAWSTTHFDANDTVKDSLYYQEHPDGAGLDKYEKEALQQAVLSYNTPTTYMLDPHQNVIAEIELNNKVIAASAFVMLGLDGQQSAQLYGELGANGFLNFLGGLTIAFQPDQPGFTLHLSPQFTQYEAAVISMLRGLEGGGVPLVSRYGRDIMGNQVWAADPRLVASWLPMGEGYKNFETAYALTGEVLKNISADAGTSWRLENIAGGETYLRDARGYVTETSYDALHRPSAVTVTPPLGAPWTAEAYFYGDQLVNREPIGPLRRLYRLFDQSGMREYDSYSLGGLPLQSLQKFLLDPSAAPDWTGKNAHFDSPLLESTSWNSLRGYNALSNLKQAENSFGYRRYFGQFSWAYTVDGKVASAEISIWGRGESASVDVVEYNAQGQRARLEYANNVVVEYTYYPKTFRLSDVVATRKGDGVVLQKLHYVYDPVGNVTHCGDGAFNALFGSVSGASPDRDYVYDALYRLIQATAPERAGYGPGNELQPGYEGLIVPQVDGSLPAGSLATATWRNAYDSAGNLFWSEHTVAQAPPWTQQMVLSVASNRAVSTGLFDVPGDTQAAAPQERTAPAAQIDAFFDAAGNQAWLENQAAIVWDFRSRMAMAQLPAGQGATSSLVLNHDAGNSLVRRVASTPSEGGTQSTDTRYLGGIVVETTTGVGQPSITTYRIQLADDELLVAEMLVDAESPNASVHYLLADQLTSVTQRLDANGSLSNYESYTPYGATAFVVAPDAADLEKKQERFDQKPRDRVTSLYDFGRRFFAPWLRRWLSPDPLGDVDGLNLFAFVGGNPSSFLDSDGSIKTRSGTVYGEGPRPAPRGRGRGRRATVAPRRRERERRATVASRGRGRRRGTAENVASSEVATERSGATSADYRTKRPEIDQITDRELMDALTEVAQSVSRSYSQATLESTGEDKRSRLPVYEITQPSDAWALAYGTLKDTELVVNMGKVEASERQAPNEEGVRFTYVRRLGRATIGYDVLTLKPNEKRQAVAQQLKRYLLGKDIIQLQHPRGHRGAMMLVIALSESSRSITAPLEAYIALYNMQHGTRGPTMRQTFDPAGNPLFAYAASSTKRPDHVGGGKVGKAMTQLVETGSSNQLESNPLYPQQIQNLRLHLKVLDQRNNFEGLTTKKQVLDRLKQRLAKKFRVQLGESTSAS